MQAVFAYLRGGRIAVGPWFVQGRGSVGRIGTGGTAFASYLLAFAYGSDHVDSVHERRASDWTMPTREDIGRAGELTSASVSDVQLSQVTNVAAAIGPECVKTLVSGFHSSVFSYSAQVRHQLLRFSIRFRKSAGTPTTWARG